VEGAFKAHCIRSDARMQLRTVLHGLAKGSESDDFYFAVSFLQEMPASKFLWACTVLRSEPLKCVEVRSEPAEVRTG
jgi:hypothetical protein